MTVSAPALPPTSGLAPQRSHCAERGAEGPASRFKGLRITLCSAGRRVQRYLAAFCGRDREPYRSGSAGDFTSNGDLPWTVVRSASPSCTAAAPRNADIHETFKAPPSRCVRWNIAFLENKLRAKERELNLRAGQPRLISELLSEWTGGHEFFAEREKILARIKDESAEIISQYLAFEGAGPGVHSVMTKESVAQKIEGIFVRNQMEFLARVLAYGKEADALTMYRRAHFETRPLRADGFPSTRYPNTIRKAQTTLFERMFAAGVEKMGGRKPPETPSGELERLVHAYFRKEAIRAMRKFVDEHPGYARIHDMTPTQTVRDFEARFVSRLGKPGTCIDYMNDGSAAALQSALLRKKGGASPSEKRIVEKLEVEMNPAVLLTRASERAGMKILRQEVSRMLDAAKTARTAKNRPALAIRVKSPAIQQNPQKHRKNGHQIR